jgi:Raf kinase inhibitor-like YbhB/YbcL family protein
VIRAIGRRLRGWRAGMEHRVAEDDRFFDVPHAIELRSDAFASGEAMPASRESPALQWSVVPAAAQSLVLVVEDVDAPLPRPFTHAIVYAIDPAIMSFTAGAIGRPDSPQTGDEYDVGYNGIGRRAYIAPSPLPGHGVHRYVFTLLAVDYVPRFDQPPTRGRLLNAVAGHVVALGELIGTAER